MYIHTKTKISHENDTLIFELESNRYKNVEKCHSLSDEGKKKERDMNPKKCLDDIPSANRFYGRSVALRCGGRPINLSSLENVSIHSCDTCRKQQTKQHTNDTCHKLFIWNPSNGMFTLNSLVFCSLETLRHSDISQTLVKLFIASQQFSLSTHTHTNRSNIESFRWILDLNVNCSDKLEELNEFKIDFVYYSGNTTPFNSPDV